MYCIIDQKTKKAVQVGTGTNYSFYKKIGMTDQELEQAFDGSYYLKGYAPTQSQEQIDLEQTQTKLNKLNQSLNELKENYISAILSGNEDIALQIKEQYQTLLNNGE